MNRLRYLGKLLIVLLALPLMGQTQNCGNLDKVVKDLLDTKFGAGSSGNKIYISNLSFVDAETKSTMPAGDAELINAAVEDGMKSLANQDPKYVVNAPGKSLPNNDANAKKLSDIFWDPNLDRKAKVDKMISELMEPNGVDGLVAGQHQEKKDGTIVVRPFVISRSSRNFVTESRQFNAGEYKCDDPQNPNKKVLCQKASEDVRDIVIRLLKQL